jgi:competence protein ComEC
MPLLALSLISGTFSGSVVRPAFIPSLIFIICFALIVAATIFVRAFRRSLILFLVAAFCFGVGAAGISVGQSLEITAPLNGRYVSTCEGVVRDMPTSKSWGVRVDVDLVGCSEEKHGEMSPATGGVRLSILRGGDYRPGDLIRFRSRLKRPRDYANPGAFKYARYLMVHGIAAQGYVVGKVQIVKSADSSWPTSWLMGWRTRVGESIAASIEGDRRGVVEAMALGQRDGITSELREKFSRSGIAHLLAISGLHVGYAALLVYLLIRLLIMPFPTLIERYSRQRIAAAAALPIIWGYVVMTGAAISAVRAGLMISVYLIGVLSLRRQHLPSTLGAAICAILIVAPLSVLDLSFQLSIAAVAAIIILTPPIIERLGLDGMRKSFFGRVLRWIIMLAVISFVASLGTMPIVAHYFHIVTALGLITNIIAVPLTGFILVPSIALASILSIIYAPLAVPIWKVAGASASHLIGIADFVSRWGTPLIFRWSPGVVLVIAAYLSIAIIAVCCFRSHRRAIVAMLAIIALVGVGYMGIKSVGDEKLELSFIDVGLGDSTVVRFPTGEVMLIDGGGRKGSSFDIGKNVVAPALWRMGIREIDWMVLTHPHADHFRGLGFVAQEFGPKLFMMGGGKASRKEYRDWNEFQKQIDHSGTPTEIISSKGKTMHVGDVRIEMMRLPDDEIEELNDSSIVMKITYGDTNFLLNGDLAASGEQKLLFDQGRVDLLKVGHHGAGDATTEEFLDIIRPSYAIISVGENPYGMPDVRILERLEDVRAKTFRTDEDGMVSVTSDGDDLEVGTYR